MSKKEPIIARKKGTPKGNQRAVTHGIYSGQIQPSEKALFRRIRNGSIEQELKMLRLRLIRVQARELEYLMSREETGPDTEAGLELTEIERKSALVGASGQALAGSSVETGCEAAGPEACVLPGEEVKRVRKRPDYDSMALRVTAEIARLERVRVAINADARNEKAQRKKTTLLQKFRKGELTAVEAACLIEEAGLKLPETIAIVLQKTPPPEAEEPKEYGYTEEELDARYAESVTEEKRQVEEFLPRREEEVREIKEELKGQASFDVEEMIRKAEDMGEKPANSKEPGGPDED